MVGNYQLDQVSLILLEHMTSSPFPINPWQGKVDPVNGRVSGTFTRQMLLTAPDGPVRRGIAKYRAKNPGNATSLSSVGQGEGNDDLSKETLPIARHLMPSMAGTSLSTKHWVFTHRYKGTESNSGFESSPSVTARAIPASNLAAVNLIMAQVQAEWITNKEDMSEAKKISYFLEGNSVEGIIASGSNEDSNSLIKIGPEAFPRAGGMGRPAHDKSSEYHSVVMDGLWYCYNIFRVDPVTGGKVYFVLKRVKAPTVYNVSDRARGQVYPVPKEVRGTEILQFVPLALEPGVGIPRQLLAYTHNNREYLGYALMVGIVNGMVPDALRSSKASGVASLNETFDDASMGTDLQGILIDVNIRF